MSQAQPQEQTQQVLHVSPETAALHLSAAAEFWENRAKILQHMLNQAATENERLKAELEKLAQGEAPKSQKAAQ